MDWLVVISKISICAPLILADKVCCENTPRSGTPKHIPLSQDEQIEAIQKSEINIYNDVRKMHGNLWVAAVVVVVVVVLTTTTTTTTTTALPPPSMQGANGPASRRPSRSESC